MISEKAKREVKVIFASLVILVGVRVFWATGGFFEVILDPTVTRGVGYVVLFALIVVVLATTLVGSGVEMLIEIIGVVNEEDSAHQILQDYPRVKCHADEDDIHRRIVKMILIREEEVKIMEALGNSLSERTKLRKQS